MTRPFSSLCLLSAGLALFAHGSVHATDASEANTLPAIAVQGERDINAEAKKEIRNIPGGVSIRTAEEYREKVVIGLGEALEFVPGVYVQRLSGQEATRISIRGSGISSTYVSGIRFLRDGLPIGRVDDLNQGVLADVMNNDRIEIYRGASSLQYGASLLGGAVNLISSTGYTSPGVTLRTEAGSNGYLSGQIKAGKVFENGIDTFVSATHYQSDGFRKQSAERTSRLYANLGYAFSATSRGRFHITEERYDGQFPGTLTLAQIRNNPQLADPNFKAIGAYLTISPRWHMAYQHELDLADGDKLSFGGFHTGTKFDSLTPNTRILYDETDYGISMRHEINRPIAGHANRFVWGMNYGRGNGDNVLYTPAIPFLAPATRGTVRDERSATEIFGENTYHVTDRLALVAGAQFSRAMRATNNNTASFITDFPNGEASRTYTYLNPKIGTIWTPTGGSMQFYANLSRNHEAPSSVGFYTQRNSMPNAPKSTLNVQRADTVEVGTRGGDKAFGWEVAVYRSRIRNELLAIANTTSPALPAINVNADSPTLHSGVELGLNGTQGMPSLSGSMEWNVVYTFSRFRFDDNRTYGNNRLPGIPEHVLQAGWTYRHASGFYLGPSVVLGSDWYADQANTLKAPGYGVLNLGAGYISRSGYRLFLDARNLGDKHYASTANYLVDARTQQTNVFRPGQTRAVYVGIETRF